MGRPLSLLSLLAASSLSLFAAPALAEEGPPPPAPAPYGASAPAPYGASAPAPYGAPFPAAGAYGAYDQPFEPPPAPTERLRPGMMVTGILFVSLGATAMSIGSAVYASRIGGGCVVTSPGGPGSTLNGCAEDSTQFVGTMILLTGGMVTAIGIPLWIFGASSARIGQEPREARAPTLLVGPRSAALRFAF